MLWYQDVIKKRGKRAREGVTATKEKPKETKEDSLQRLVASVKAKSTEQQRKKKAKKQWD